MVSARRLGRALGWYRWGCGGCRYDGESAAPATERFRRFGWKAFLLAAVVVAMVWLVVAQRARILESLELIARANWWWVGAAVLAQAVSMGAMARQQRRLLGRRR